MLMLPLGLNFVSTTLYNALARQVGHSDAIARWNDSTKKMDVFEGSRAEQLQASLTLSPAEKDKVNLLFTSINMPKNLLSLEDKTSDTADDNVKYIVLSLLLKKLVPNAFQSAERLYFTREGATVAMGKAVLECDDKMRQELMDFELFASAMNGMRKQWIPQAGAGSSSNGLENQDTCALYQLAASFIASSCDLSVCNVPTL
jgi:hypothetical protein